MKSDKDIEDSKTDSNENQGKFKSLINITDINWHCLITDLAS